VQGVKQALGVMRGEDDPRFYLVLILIFHVV
jgi:hypothetical protein